MTTQLLTSTDFYSATNPEQQSKVRSKPLIAKSKDEAIRDEACTVIMTQRNNLAGSGTLIPWLNIAGYFVLCLPMILMAEAFWENKQISHYNMHDKAINGVQNNSVETLGDRTSETKDYLDLYRQARPILNMDDGRFVTENLIEISHKGMD